MYGISKTCSPNCDGKPKMMWLEVVNKDLKELGICKADVLHRTRWKQLICESSAARLLGSCLFQYECLIPAHPDVPEKVLQKRFVVVTV